LQNPLQTPCQLCVQSAANYLAFIQLASNRVWLRVNESTP